MVSASPLTPIWKLEYYDGGLPLKSLTSDGCRWAELGTIDTVQRVRVSTHGYTIILQGMDCYWIDEDCQSFGQFVEPGNEDVYKGSLAVAYRAVDGGFIHLGELLPKVGTNVLSSVYMPDDEAREVGIL